MQVTPFWRTVLASQPTFTEDEGRRGERKPNRELVREWREAYREYRRLQPMAV